MQESGRTQTHRGSGVRMSTSRTSRLLGHLLRRYHLSRAVVAEGMHVSEDTIDNWCTGRSSMRPHMLSALIQFLKEQRVTAQELGEFVRAETQASGMDVRIISEYISKPTEGWDDAVVVLINDPRSVSQNTLLAGVWSTLQGAHGYPMMTLCDWFDGRQHEAHLDEIAKHHPPAVIIASRCEPTPESRRLRQQLVENGVRIVSTSSSGVPGETVISMSEQGVMDLALKHLAKLGHRNIGALFVRDSPVQVERYKGWQKAIQANGLSAESCVVRWAPLDEPERVDHGLFGQPSLNRVATQLAKREDVTALFAPSEVAAASLMMALQQEGRRCPEDVSVLAVRPCTWLDALLNPPLTHVNPPYYRLGRLAAEAVLLQPAGTEMRGRTLDCPSHVALCAEVGGTFGPPS